ncbi:MAG: (Fe-S)-binding protein [Deltaproteobacteria bacterium]|nr:(Fe-S)-binding protein [Deltaproteobacteria bacterium]MBW2319121.1 (Fe-S)-binding protein [Deltaproteobacteria bacterium]OEU44905.1 MAG: menaquinol oxidoreductase [Desulfobacterales bacterium S7086C20]
MPRIPKDWKLPQEPGDFLSDVGHTPEPRVTGWMNTPPVEIKRGMHCYAAKPDRLKKMGMPNPREWSAMDDDWKLPENWKETFLDGMKDRLGRFRTFQLFMDICVRCGACADKCHFYIGSGDPKNMPVLRAELLRSIYRQHFTTAGKILGPVAGARELTYERLKELWYYLYQCSECRRCSVFCPYGIDMAEITIMGRELTNLLGLNIDWIAAPVAFCYQTGNHMGIQPHAFVEMLEFFVDEIEEVTGVRVQPDFNRKGAEVLFVTPSGDVFGDPGTYTCMGYMILFHELKKLGLDITWSTYASEGGNFGLFTSNEVMKRLNSKMYAEAKRLGVKWILGGECGHMWRVVNQYMGTMNLELAEGSKMEEPVSPITGTKFENAKSTKMVHITEFTADLIRNNKLKLDPSRNDHLTVTFHDSCNPARGMGLFEEPRYVIKNVCNNFYEMPENTIREQTFCCGGGSGLNAGEDMELRMRGGLPRANAVKYAHEQHGVNMMACICAIDRAVLPDLMTYYVPEVDITGIHELVTNAMVLDGEKKKTVNLRGEPLPGKEDKK